MLFRFETNQRPVARLTNATERAVRAGVRGATVALLLWGAGVISPAAAQANPDLAVTGIQQTPSPGIVNRNLTYKVTLTNQGSSAATQVILLTHHSEQFEWLDNALQTAGGQPVTGVDIFSPGPPFNDLDVRIPSLAAGATVVFTIEVKPKTTGSFPFSAEVSMLETDPTPSNNQANASTTVGAGSTPELPQLAVLGVAASPHDAPRSELTVQPGQVVFGFVKLGTKAKKAVTVQFFLPGVSTPIATTSIQKGKLEPRSSRSRPYPFPLPIPAVTGATTLVIRGTIEGADPSDSRFSKTVTLHISPNLLVAGLGSGSPQVRTFSAGGQSLGLSFLAFPAKFKGGVRVALGDINGDGQADLVTGSGRGTGQVRVFDGKSGAQLAAFFPYGASFKGGVFVAAGDVNGDGKADIVTGAGAGGGPLVKIFSGANQQLLQSFLAFDSSFTGGVTVAMGDLNGDEKLDLITGAASGGAAVRAFSGSDGAELAAFFPYGPDFRGGVNVAAGDVNGDGAGDIVTAPASGAPAQIRAFGGVDLAPLANFFASEPTFRGGATAAAGDLDGDGRAEIITGAGAGGDPVVKIFSDLGAREVAAFFAFDPRARGGVFVASRP